MDVASSFLSFVMMKNVRIPNTYMTFIPKGMCLFVFLVEFEILKGYFLLIYFFSV